MSATIHRGSEFAERTEQAVVRECAGGDTAAVAELYRRHHGRLIAFFVRRTHDRSLAEDLAHDSMLRFLGAVGRFDDTRPVWPYLKVTAHNVLIDHLRKSQRQIPVDATTSFEDEDEAGEDFAERVVLQPLLREAIALLPDRQQAAVELRYARGWSLPDAAEFLGMTTGALTQLLFRARQTLKAALEESGARLNGLVIPMLLALKWRVRGAADRAKAWANSQSQFATVSMDSVVGLMVAAGLTMSLAGGGQHQLDFDPVAGRSTLPASVAPESSVVRDSDAPRVEDVTDDFGSDSSDHRRRPHVELARVTTPEAAAENSGTVALEESGEEVSASHEVSVSAGIVQGGGGGPVLTVSCQTTMTTTACDVLATWGPDPSE